MEIKQYGIYLIDLAPAKGHEMKKIRPCVVISPDEMNRNILTVIIAPMTTKSHNYPTRVKIIFQNKPGWVVFDQIRAVDKRRLTKELGKVKATTIKKIKSVITEMLVD
ncbi:MAG: type II toxin-antitoxin system PemK/MazF family toxin [Nitrospirota bacterium]